MPLHISEEGEEIVRLRAEVADLKARLREVRSRLVPCSGTCDCLECDLYLRVTDLRRKDWEKP